MSDLIRRQDAIDVVEKYFSETLSLNSDICTDGIRSLPSAQPERKKGEWKWSHGGQCSECGFHNSNFDYKYCPMCGADMRGEANE